LKKTAENFYINLVRGIKKEQKEYNKEKRIK
jgi:hypothetical protein